MNNASKMNFIAELDLLKTIDHPNIIKLYDLFYGMGIIMWLLNFAKEVAFKSIFKRKKDKSLKRQSELSWNNSCQFCVTWTIRISFIEIWNCKISFSWKNRINKVQTMKSRSLILGLLLKFKSIKKTNLNSSVHFFTLHLNLAKAFLLKSVIFGARG